jgi:tRNA uridine 5-carboxymethylaminomethyl modification enzyme
LLTNDIDNIAQMNCNPSVGGRAKSQLVQEINSLGGLMGLAADESGIHFKNLNGSRGEAVQCLRVQCDKYKYKDFIKNKLERVKGITIIQGVLLDIKCILNKVVGITTSVGVFTSKTVILTTGTFLKSHVYIGKKNQINSKFYLNNTLTLNSNLSKFGITSLRFKTGTPPRISKHGINFFKFLPQPTDYNYTFNKYFKKLNLVDKSLKTC